MKHRDEETGPLPETWLPESPVPPDDDDVYWEARMARLLADAEAPLAALRRRRRPAPSLLEILGGLWRPATAGGLVVAGATVVVLMLTVPPSRSPAAEGRDAVLRAMVGGGNPAALWSGPEGPADPTLALLALEARPDGREGGR